jgi:hypothetical protein
MQIFRKNGESPRWFETFRSPQYGECVACINNKSKMKQWKIFVDRVPENSLNKDMVKTLSESVMPKFTNSMITN